MLVNTAGTKTARARLSWRRLRERVDLPLCAPSASLLANVAAGMRACSLGEGYAVGRARAEARGVVDDAGAYVALGEESADKPTECVHKGITVLGSLGC